MRKVMREASVLPFKLRKTVVMVGMMGAGKSAIGTALARRLDVPFLDSDAEIERAASRTIAEIFERDGEEFFRDRETQVIARLLGGVPKVLATGGGAFLGENNRKLIGERGLSVWLRADLDLLWQRVRHKATRPLLQTKRPKQKLASLYEERTPVYALADVTVDADPSSSIDETTDRVLKALYARNGVLAECR